MSFENLDEILEKANSRSFRVSEEYSKSKNDFFIEMAKTLPPPKERKVYTKEEIIAMQPKSTQKMMLMSDEEHKAFHETPIDPTGQTTLADINLSDDELAAKVNKRTLTSEETINYVQHRQTSKNTQHQFTEGHGNLLARGSSSVTPETREKGINAFVYSQPVPPERINPKEIVGLKQIKSEPFELPIQKQPKYTEEQLRKRWFSFDGESVYIKWIGKIW